MFRNLRKSASFCIMPFILCALILRVLVPAGWMPSDQKGQMITLCTGMGVKQVWFGNDGAIADKAPVKKQHSDGSDDNSCAFSGTSFAALGESYANLHRNLLYAQTPAIQYVQGISIGRGLAAPPPPATGPPSLI